MDREDSLVEFQHYSTLPEDPIHSSAALLSDDDPCIGASSTRLGINQTLSVKSSSLAITPIKRKPVHFGNTYAKVKSNAARDDLEVDDAIVSNSEEAEKAFNDKNDADNPPEKWPVSATTIRQYRQSPVMEICMYFFMAIGAALFLIFALLSASVHSTYPGTGFKYAAGGPILPALNSLDNPGMLLYPDGTSGELGYNFSGPENNALNIQLLQAAKIGPTVFPILFAGIVTSTIRLVARWRAEKGSIIETLEILIGGRSFASTISTMLSLRAFDAVGIGIVFLWALSPLAGQASLRVLNMGNVTDAIVNLHWLIQTIRTFLISTARLLSISGPRAAPVIYVTDVQSTGTGDQIFLPMTPSNTSWSVSNAQSPSNFTSLVGLTMLGPVMYLENQFSFINGDGYGISYNSSIKLPVGHYEFICPSVSEDLTNGSWTSMLGSSFIYANHSALIQERTTGSGFFLDTNASFSSQAEGPQHVLFGSFSNSKITLWHCLLYLNTREIILSCRDDIFSSSFFSCSLESMGISTLISDTPFSNYSVAASYFGQWPLVDVATPGVSSQTEIFLAQGYTTAFEQSIIDLSELDNITFATRLTTAFNTWLGTTRGGPSYINATSATALKVLPFDIMNCNWLFFSILAITSTFLILCCAFSIWLLFKISTPDVLGYVSSSTFDNPYFFIPGVRPGSGSALDGITCAKLLKRVRVQIRDVQPEEEIGKFALTNEIDSFLKPSKNRSFV